MKRGVLWLPQSHPINFEQFSVLGLGVREPMSPGFVYRPNGMDSYLLMHFHDPVEIEVAEKMRKYPANTFVLWKPWDKHHFGNSKRVWKHSWLHCYGSVIPSITDDSTIAYGAPLLLSHSAPADECVPRIYQELTAHMHPDLRILECFVIIWLRQVCRFLKSTHEQHIPRNILTARRYMEDKIDEHLNIDDLAKMAGLSLSHFITKFKYYYGEPPLQFHISLKLNRAAYLLHNSNITIAKVSEKIGMEDPFYFSRLFRKKFGKSPRRFR